MHLFSQCSRDMSIHVDSQKLWFWGQCASRSSEWIQDFGGSRFGNPAFGIDFHNAWGLEIIGKMSKSLESVNNWRVTVCELCWLFNSRTFRCMQQIEHLLRQWSSKSSKSGKSGKRRRMPRLKKRASVVLGAMRRCDGMGIPSDAHAFGRFRRKSANNPTTACNSSLMRSFYAHLVLMLGLLQCAGPATPWGSQEESPTGKGRNEEVNRSSNSCS